MRAYSPTAGPTDVDDRRLPACHSEASRSPSPAPALRLARHHETALTVGGRIRGPFCLPTGVVSQQRTPTIERRLAVPARAPLQAVLITARPRQWLKNLLVVAAAGAAGALGHDDVPVRVALACAAFCMLASGIYAI